MLKTLKPAEIRRSFKFQNDLALVTKSRLGKNPAIGEAFSKSQARFLQVKEICDSLQGVSMVDVQTGQVIDPRTPLKDNPLMISALESMLWLLELVETEIQSVNVISWTKEAPSLNDTSLDAKDYRHAKKVISKMRKSILQVESELRVALEKTTELNLLNLLNSSPL